MATAKKSDAPGGKTDTSAQTTKTTEEPKVDTSNLDSTGRDVTADMYPGQVPAPGVASNELNDDGDSATNS